MYWVIFAGVSFIGYRLFSDKINAWANVYSNELFTEIPPIIVNMDPPVVDITVKEYCSATSFYAIDLIRRF